MLILEFYIRGWQRIHLTMSNKDVELAWDCIKCFKALKIPCNLIYKCVSLDKETLIG